MKIPKIKTYTAPIYLKIKNGALEISPGISTQIPWSPVPGTRCLWKNTGQLVEILNTDTTDFWIKKEFSVVPLNLISPEINTSILILKQDLKTLTLLPPDEAPPNCEIITLAFAPKEYAESYGQYYVNENAAIFYDKSDKVQVEIKYKEFIPPKTWIENV